MWKAYTRFVENITKRDFQAVSLVLSAKQTVNFTATGWKSPQLSRQMHCLFQKQFRNKSYTFPAVFYSSQQGLSKCGEKRHNVFIPDCFSFQERSLFTTHIRENSPQSTANQVNPTGLRKKRKRKVQDFSIQAFALAEEFKSLESVTTALEKTGLYKVSQLPTDAAAVHSTFIYQTVVPQIPREFFVFEKGAVVFWNVEDPSQKRIIETLESLTVQKYSDYDMEGEFMGFYIEESATEVSLRSGNIRIPPQNKENKEQLLLEKFAISHGLMLAVQLDYCETQLQKFIEKLAYIPEDMKTKGKMTTEPRQAVRYIGELYDLRHRVLLESEYMETPEFFWNREELEGLFDNVRRHLELKNRVDVMKSKLSLCIDLMDNIQEALTHQHGARLEWIIIILIASEILIELLRWKGATVWAWLWGEEAAEKSDKLEQLNQEDSDPISRD